MPMYFFQISVRPKETNPDKRRYGGATVNCWILRHELEQAAVVARGWIADQDWRIETISIARMMTKEQQAEFPEGIPYFDQAEIDREVFVFHTWPIKAAQN